MKEKIKPTIKNIEKNIVVEKPQNFVKVSKLSARQLKKEIADLPPPSFNIEEKAQPTSQISTPTNKELAFVAIDMIKKEQDGRIADPEVIISAQSKKLERLKRPQKKSRVLRKTFHYAKKHIIFLILSLFCAFVNSIAEVLIPVFSGFAIDCLIGQGEVDFMGLKKYIFLIIICAVVYFIFEWLQETFQNMLSNRTSKTLRDEIYKKFNKIPLKYIDGTSHGDLQSRMINDVEDLTSGILEGISSIFDAFMTIVLTIYLMFVYSWQIATTVIVLTPVSVLVTLLIAKKSNKYFFAQAKALGTISGNIIETIGNQRVVCAFNYQDRALEKFEKLNNNLKLQTEKAGFYSALSNPTSRFINSVIYGIVAIMGCNYALQGVMTVGAISVLLSYANEYIKPFNDISGIIGDLQQAYASAKRIFNFLDVEDEKTDRDYPLLERIEGKVSFEKVAFSYTPTKPLIQSLNATVASGQKIAIVGPTGCGKSTLINLLMRFYDINSGDIKIDGQSIYQVTRKSLRSQFGMVLQDTWLFASTIKDNIAYGKSDATMQEIINASKLAHAHEFIQTLPNGYDTVVTDGGENLSAGQRQLICIARIMLTKPPMLILDEATSNIDTRTELLIQSAFDEIMKGRTSFVVAHRLSTIVSADLILVMNKGDIIEQGTHKELLEKQGFYYALYNSQFQNN